MIDDRSGLRFGGSYRGQLGRGGGHGDDDGPGRHHDQQHSGQAVVEQAARALPGLELLRPALVGLLHRLNQTVVGQLHPAGAGPNFAADEMQVLQHVDGLVGDAAGLLWAAVGQAAGASRGDQGGGKPVAQPLLADSGLFHRFAQGAFVEIGQGQVDVAEGLQMIGGDGHHLMGQLGPQVLADHLQLDRFDVLAADAAGFLVGGLYPHLAEIVDQLLSHARGKFAPGALQGVTDGR